MSRRLRVLMTIDALGGIFTYALELARGLSAEVDYHLACMGPSPALSQLEALSSTPNLRLHPSGYRLEWMDEPWGDVRLSGEWLLDLERTVRPDIVHLNGYVHGALPFAAPVLVVGHACIASWFEQVERRGLPPRFTRYKAAIEAGLRGADRVVAPTATMLGWLRRFYGPFGPAKVISTGRTHTPPPLPKEPLVASGGRLWDRAKNLESLDRAASAMPWPVEVAGPTRLQHDGREAQARHVRLLGSLAPFEMAKLLARAAIFALPTRYEPFGLLPLEAGLSGCALVLGDVPTLREIWGDAATWVPPDDHRALALAVQRLAARPERLEVRADQARARAARYSREQMARAYLEEYRTLLSTRRIRCAS